VGGLVRVDHPGAAEVAIAAVHESGEELGVDRQLSVLVELDDDALATGVELGGDNHQMVALVEDHAVQGDAELGFEGLFQR